MSEVLQRLDRVLSDRKQSSPEESYVASLHSQGLNRILEKIGEEATEVILAAKDCGEAGGCEALIGETADLWFHCLVLLSHMDMDSREILAELERRFGLSGLREKTSREQ